ncbi:MAG: hypothetical protein MK110_04780 [Fuerstiella sp.]|nr:hypothetical protein [Fuerstiella sp.]
MTNKASDIDKAVKLLANFSQEDLNQIASKASAELNRETSNNIKKKLDDAVSAIGQLDFDSLVDDVRVDITGNVRAISSWASIKTAKTATVSVKPNLTSAEINKLNKFINKNCIGKSKAMTKDALLKANGIDGLRSKDSWDGVLAGCDTDGKKGRGAGYFRKK